MIVPPRRFHQVDHSYLIIEDYLTNGGQGFGGRARNNDFLLSSQFQITTNQSLVQLFDNLPKTFVITNKGKKYFFANKVIRDLSRTINKLGSDIREFSIDIDDPYDSMQKFVDVANAQCVDIDIKTERPFFKKLSTDLNITFPYTITGIGKNYGFNNFHNSTKATCQMNLATNSISTFLQNHSKLFDIIIGQERYRCNAMAVCISKKLAKLIAEDEQLPEYVYDIEDPDKRFQIFCNYFNFEVCQITSVNIDFIEAVANDLEIDPIIQTIAKHNEKCSFGQSILDLEQDQIGLLTDLQDLLFDISQENYQRTLKQLQNSIWLQNTEKVKEFCSNLMVGILRRSKSSLLYLELVKDINSFTPSFLPFFVQYILYVIDTNEISSRFIYLMYKNGLIELDRILTSLNDKIFEDQNSSNSIHDRLFIWFLPEIDKKYPFLINNCNAMGDLYSRWQEFLAKKKEYTANDWKIYKEQRELGHNADSFADLIYHDDLNALQELLNTIQFDVNLSIPMCLFENQEPVKIINYAAYHGSAKCFKFLALNQATIDTLTFEDAIRGGNNEIIHIAYQQLPESWDKTIKSRNAMNFNPFNQRGSHSLTSVVKAALKYHRYGVFEWLIQTSKNQEDLINAIQSSVYTLFDENNITSLMTIIDSGINFLNTQNKYNNEMYRNSVSAAKHGFADFLKVVYQLSDKKFDFSTNNDNLISSYGVRPKSFSPNYQSTSVYEAASLFGSIRTLKFLLHTRKGHSLNQQIITSSLSAAAKMGHFDVIKFWIETVLHISFSSDPNTDIQDDTDDEQLSNQFSNSDEETQFNETTSSIQKCVVSLSPQNITQIVKEAAFYGFLDIVKYFANAKGCDWYKILCHASSNGQFEVVKFVFENQLKDSKEKLNKAFINAANGGHIDICTYFIEKGELKLDQDDVNKILGKVSKNGFIDVLKLALTQIPKGDREQLTSKFLNSALENGQESIALLFINLGGYQSDTLILAARKGLVSIVKYILNDKTKDPNYINNVTIIEGSALCAAAISGSLEIISLLLKEPNIDKNLHNAKNETAILLASRYDNFHAMRMIIDSYSEEEIKKEMWQVNAAFVLFFSPPPLNTPTLLDPFNQQQQQQRNYYPAPGGFNGSKPSSQNKSFFKNFDLEALHYFLGFPGIDFNAIFDSIPLLHSAVEYGKPEGVSILLQNSDIDVNILDGEGNTPLMKSIITKNFHVMELLLKCDKVDVNYINRNGDSALSLCVVFSRDISTIKRIIDSPNFKENHVNTNIAIYEYITNHFADPINNPLFQLDFDVNLKLDISPKYSFHSTLLEIACSYSSDMTIFNALINHANFEPEKNDIVSCLFSLVEINDPVAFNALLPFVNNNVNLRNKYGFTLLVRAVITNASMIVPIILTNPTFDAKLSDFNIAFQFSLYSENDITYDFLNRDEIDLNEPIQVSHPFEPQYEKFYHYYHNTRFRYSDQMHNSCFKWENDNYENSLQNDYHEEERQCFIDPAQIPLVSASFNNYGLFESILSTEGIDINKKNSDGIAPIFSILSGNDASDLFFERPDLDFNIQDNKGRTPLMIAVMSSADHVVLQMSEHDNIDLKIKDNEGKTAYDYLLDYFPLAKNIPEPKDIKEFSTIFSELTFLQNQNNNTCMYGFQ